MDVACAPLPGHPGTDRVRAQRVERPLHTMAEGEVSPAGHNSDRRANDQENPLRIGVESLAEPPAIEGIEHAQTDRKGDGNGP